MADKLLIRAYNVGVGDCIYCRIPKARKVGTKVDDFHMLIDCGSKGSVDQLEAAIAHLETILPDAGGGKKRLDLFVVTHEHEDHIKGIDPAFFKNIQIGGIWMNTAMDPKHPQAEGTNELRSLATTAMRNIASLNLSLSPELQDLVALYGFTNDAPMEALRTTLPKANGIKPKYVYAGMTQAELGLKLNGAKIHVLGPERDIDHFYLGKAGDDAVNGLAATGAAFGAATMKETITPPDNINRADFRRLQSRMMSSAFAFAELSARVTNNTSVVLLIEWKGKRLLFVGDAEWDSGFKDGRSNGAWNVMWNKRKKQLDGALSFLKIGHHGSENATPWDDSGESPESEPARILDAILPKPTGSAKPKALAVVSTKRSNYKTIPKSAMLVVLGERVRNVRNYQKALGGDASSLPNYKEFEKLWLNSAQPLRTDCENALSGAKFVDVEIEA